MRSLPVVVNETNDTTCPVVEAGSDAASDGPIDAPVDAPGQ